MSDSDPVNHPSHYTTGKIEVVDFIEDQKLDWHLGNALKYIARAGKKDANKEAEDLKKAVWYIERKIARLETPKEKPEVKNPSCKICGHYLANPSLACYCCRVLACVPKP